MASLAEIRQGMADAAGHCVGGRVYAYLTDNVQPGPEGALVMSADPGDIAIERLTLDRSFRHTLRVAVIGGGASEAEQQRIVDERISPHGDKSVWAALETPGIIPGIDYLQVLQVTNYQQYQTGTEGVRYLGAELVCEIVESA